jgi:hypothetical protein
LFLHVHEDGTTFFYNERSQIQVAHNACWKVKEEDIVPEATQVSADFGGTNRLSDRSSLCFFLPSEV